MNNTNCSTGISNRLPHEVYHFAGLLNLPWPAKNSTNAHQATRSSDGGIGRKSLPCKHNLYARPLSSATPSATASTSSTSAATTSPSPRTRYPRRREGKKERTTLTGEKAAEMVESLVVGASSRHRAVSSRRCRAVASCAASRAIVLPRAWSPFTLSAKGMAACSPSPSRPRARRRRPRPVDPRSDGGSLPQARHPQIHRQTARAVPNPPGWRGMGGAGGRRR